GYVDNPNLYRDVIKDALKAKRYGLPVLTLILRKEVGARLETMMRKAGIRAVFLKGENDNEERRKALRALAAGDLDAVIGTTILDVGVDVPAVGLVQLAGGGKAEVALRQRIGRGLRAKKNGQNVGFIIDYSVKNNLKLAEHAAQRRRIVEMTPGFAEGILPPGQDFDWSIFEQKAA